jgi:hypothetical protein
VHRLGQESEELQFHLVVDDRVLLSGIRLQVEQQCPVLELMNNARVDMRMVRTPLVKLNGSAGSQLFNSATPNRLRMWVGISVYSSSGPLLESAAARMYTKRPSVTFTCPP